MCQDVTLPDPLDARSAADVFLNPGTCLLLHGRDGHRWTPEGCRTLAYRAAGRCPLIIDDLPEPFARAIEAQLMWVLDWIGQAA